MDRKFTVLVVSSYEKSGDFIKKSGLDAEVFEIPEFAANAAAARDRLSEGTFDTVIINAPLDDESGTELAKSIFSLYGAACLIIVKKEEYKKTVAEVEPFGVACISKPMSKEAISQASRFLVAMKNMIDNSAEKSETLKSEVEDLKIINRAKCLLMEKLGLGEEEAHQHLEKQAMDLCIRKSEAAKRVIMTYEL